MSHIRHILKCYKLEIKNIQAAEKELKIRLARSIEKKLQPIEIDVIMKNFN